MHFLKCQVRFISVGVNLVLLQEHVCSGSFLQYGVQEFLYNVEYEIVTHHILMSFLKDYQHSLLNYYFILSELISHPISTFIIFAKETLTMYSLEQRSLH